MKKVLYPKYKVIKSFECKCDKCSTVHLIDVERPIERDRELNNIQFFTMQCTKCGEISEFELKG